MKKSHRAPGPDASIINQIHLNMVHAELRRLNLMPRPQRKPAQYKSYKKEWQPLLTTAEKVLKFVDMVERAMPLYEKSNRQGDILSFFDMLPARQKEGLLRSVGVDLRDGAKRFVELADKLLTLFDELQLPNGSTTMVEPISWFQHAYTQLCARGLLHGVVLSGEISGLLGVAKKYKGTLDSTKQRLETVTRDTAEKMANEWRNAMGTIPGYATYWFHGVKWEPLSVAKAGYQVNTLSKNPFRTPNGNLHMSYRSRQRMFWKVSGALRAAIRVNKLQLPNNMVGYSVGLDPVLMHHKYNSYGNIVGIGRVKRGYHGRHRGPGYSHIPEVDWESLAHARLFPHMHVEGKGGKTPMGMSGNLQRSQAIRRHMAGAARPKDSSHPLTRTLASTLESKVYQGEDVISWEEVRYPEGNWRSNVRFDITDLGSGKQRGFKLFKTVPGKTISGRNWHSDLNATRSTRLKRSTPEHHEGTRTGRSYRGSVATLLEKFLWNEYGFTRFKQRTVFNRVSGKYETQRGATVARPLFSVLMREYGKKYRDTAIRSMGAELGVQGGMYALRTAGLERSTVGQLGYTRTSSESISSDPERNALGSMVEGGVYNEARFDSFGLGKQSWVAATGLPARFNNQTRRQQEDFLRRMNSILKG